MTNVPQNLRDMWADAYRLFDLNYNIQNTPEAWKKFWEDAQEIAAKYHQNRYLWVFITTISEMIEDHITERIYHPCTLEDTAKF